MVNRIFDAPVILHNMLCFWCFLLIKIKASIQFISFHLRICLKMSNYLAGDPGSAVFGSVIDGVFEGKIISKSKGTFYVEKSRHYFPGENNASFHSVIYNEKDVADPYESLREGMAPQNNLNAYVFFCPSRAVTSPRSSSMFCCFCFL